MAYVYAHTRNDTNEVFYIGIGTDSKGLYSRANNKHSRNNFWIKIFKKVGRKVHILYDNIEEDLAYFLEVQLIQFHGRRDLGLGTLCNLTDGGKGTKGHILTEEIRLLLSQLKTGTTLSENTRKKMSESGRRKIFTEEHRRNLSISGKGKKRSPELCERIRQSQLGRKHSEETKKKMSEAQKGLRKGIPNDFKAIKVSQYTLDGKFLAEFRSLQDAADSVGIHSSNITVFLKGKSKQAGGFLWKRVDLD